MPCCKCCCGNKDCGAGEQGKCCCGETCCQEGEYCCDGVCQETPCLGACCDEVFGCTQTADEETCTGEGGEWLGHGVPCDPNPCGCQDNEDCGCETLGSTYYPELEALSPGQGCCPTGTFFDPELPGCWDGNPGSESASEANLCCCDGACGECPTLCVYQAEDVCGNLVWLWYADTGTESQCVEDGGTWHIGTELVTIPSHTIHVTSCDDPQTQPSIEVDPCTGVEALSFSAKSKKPVESTPAAGPGTELKKLLSKIGIKSSPSCSCNKRAAEMDRQGVAWCEQNVETICDWLQEESTKRKLPFVRLAGKALIYMAIRRATRGNSK